MITEQEISRQINHLQGELHPQFATLLTTCNEYELCDRRNFTGHITTSGIIVHIRTREILLLHHKTLDRWLAPGGHVEWEDRSILAAALREVSEETGLQPEQLFPMNVDNGVQYCVAMDSHTIPPNEERSELGHWHHDFRFIFGYAGDKQIDIDRDESRDYRWLSVDDPHILDMFDSESIDKIVLEGVARHEQAVRDKHNNDYLTTPIGWYQFHLAKSYVTHGQIERAEQMYVLSIDSFEKTYDEESETPPTILPALWNLSLIYQETNRHDLALQTLEKGLEFAEMYAKWDENYSNWVTELTDALSDIHRINIGGVGCSTD